MSSPALQAFEAKIAQSRTLQEKLRSLQSPMELILLAKEQGIELSGEDLQTIAQTAFQKWVNQLPDKLRSFFEIAQSTPELNQQIKQCQTPEQVITLAQGYGFELTEADLRQAALLAQTIEGFSFEKLWFKGLGIL